MIRINQLKMPLGHSRQELLEKAARLLGIPGSEIERLNIVKQSIDARKKPDIMYSYIVDVAVKNIGVKKEEGIVKRLKKRDVVVQRDQVYRLPASG